jgi:hypothetical protein
MKLWISSWGLERGICQCLKGPSFRDSGDSKKSSCAFPSVYASGRRFGYGTSDSYDLLFNCTLQSSSCIGWKMGQHEYHNGKPNVGLKNPRISEQYL